MSTPQKAIGMAWYYEPQWDKLRNYSKDRATMEPRYADWLAKAERAVKDYERVGFRVHKVYLDVELLIAWAKRHRLDIDYDTRANYANHLLAAHRGLNSDV